MHFPKQAAAASILLAASALSSLGYCEQLTTRDLLGSCQSDDPIKGLYCDSFIAGFHSGIDYAVLLRKMRLDTDPRNASRDIGLCVSDPPVKNKELRMIFVKFASSAPDLMDQHPGLTLGIALTRAYPCN